MVSSPSDVATERPCSGSATDSCQLKAVVRGRTVEAGWPETADGGESGVSGKEADGHGSSVNGAVEKLPFASVPGEEFLPCQGQLLDNNGSLYLTTYRLVAQFAKKYLSIPLKAIETVGEKDLFSLQIQCKDGKSFSINCSNNENCLAWLSRINEARLSDSSIDDLFAFTYAKSVLPAEDASLSSSQTSADERNQYRILLDAEIKRLGFKTGDDGIWKVSQANETYDVCNSYPPYHVVPRTLDDELLKEAAQFRTCGRFLSIVWRSVRTGAVLVRSSQPTVGFFGRRSSSDEQLVNSIIEACQKDRPLAGGQQSPVVGRAAVAAGAPTAAAQPVQSHLLGVNGNGNLADSNSDNMIMSRVNSGMSNAKNGNDVSQPFDVQSAGLHVDSADARLNGQPTLPAQQDPLAADPSHVVHNRTADVDLSVIDATDSDDQPNTETTITDQSPPSPAATTDAAETSTTGTTSQRSLLLMDLRSYTHALANRTRGGGAECAEYYTDCEVVFMSHPNIHAIRRSFLALRALFEAYGSASDSSNAAWFSGLDSTQWLHNIANLMRTALKVATVLEREHRPVIVHCSDGWDRTAQVVSLAELLVDPYYRTIKGFQVLVEREWVAYGHKFSHRCGHLSNGDRNDLSPVFLQWLDCVHQLLLQFPDAFEFNMSFLVKLAVHTYSCLFGTFLCNTWLERFNHNVEKGTISIWRFLADVNFNPNCVQFRNAVYVRPLSAMKTLLEPNYHLRKLHVWAEVYYPKIPNNPTGNDPMTESLSIVTTSDGLIGGAGAGEGCRSAGPRCHSSPNQPVDGIQGGQPANSQRRFQQQQQSYQQQSTLKRTRSDELLQSRSSDRLAESCETIGEPAVSAHFLPVTQVDSAQLESSRDPLTVMAPVEPVTPASVCSTFSPGAGASHDAFSGKTDELRQVCDKISQLGGTRLQRDPVCGRVAAESAWSSSSSRSSSSPPTSSASDQTNFVPIRRPVGAGQFDSDGLVAWQCPADEALERALYWHNVERQRLQVENGQLRRAIAEMQQQMRESERNSNRSNQTTSSSGNDNELTDEWHLVKPTDTLQWYPDLLYPSCSTCNRLFQVYRRRHHCRSCGHVFCSSCSPYRARIPTRMDKYEHRVCLRCYGQLKQANVPVDADGPPPDGAAGPLDHAGQPLDHAGSL